MQNEIITYTQHTGEVFARGAEAAARTGVPAGTQKAVRARENRVASAQASGRSMIEMLGVLAIIGVLSVGALSGYRMAMTKYRANEVIDYAMRVGEGALHHGTTQKTGSIPNTDDDACKSYVNGEEPPFDMNCNMQNGGTTVLYAYLFLGGGSYSAELGTAIQKQIGTCGVGRYPCVQLETCPTWIGGSLVGQPCMRVMFKR